MRCRLKCIHLLSFSVACLGGRLAFAGYAADVVPVRRLLGTRNLQFCIHSQDVHLEEVGTTPVACRPVQTRLSANGRSEMRKRIAHLRSATTGSQFGWTIWSTLKVTTHSIPPTGYACIGLSWPVPTGNTAPARKGVTGDCVHARW